MTSLKDIGERLAVLSDAVLSEDGVVARKFDTLLILVRTVADSQLRMEAKINTLIGDHEETKAKLVLLERPHKANGNGIHE